jgi:hypothetical protein
MPGGRSSDAPTARDLVTSLYLWGPDRDEVNRLAADAAERMDPAFAWVEVSDHYLGEESEGRPERGVAAPTRAFAPPRGVSGERIWTYLRQSGQQHDGQDLQRFTQMSDPIQQAIGQLLERAVPRVLVIANLERLREFFCTEQPGPHPFIEWVNAREITLVVTSTGAPLHEGIHFDWLLSRPDSSGNGVRRPIVAIHQRGDRDPGFVQRLFRPLDVVFLSGLAPAAPPDPPVAARVPSR